MSLQDEYRYMQSGQWAEHNAETCPCHGGGWCLSDLDTWHQCHIHYNGQLHVDEIDCNMTDADIAEAEAKSKAQWAAEQERKRQPKVEVVEIHEIPF